MSGSSDSVVPTQRPFPQDRVHSWSAAAESQVGMCTPLVTWPTGTSTSGQRGNNGWNSRRAGPRPDVGQRRLVVAERREALEGRIEDRLAA